MSGQEFGGIDHALPVSSGSVQQGKAVSDLSPASFGEAPSVKDMEAFKRIYAHYAQHAQQTEAHSALHQVSQEQLKRELKEVQETFNAMAQIHAQIEREAKNLSLQS